MDIVNVTSKLDNMNIDCTITESDGIKTESISPNEPNELEK